MDSSKTHRRGINLYPAFYLLGVLVALGVAWFQSGPGYMDAAYYYAGGTQISTGQGWTEPFIWNYLGDPEGIPQPAFTYWMPGPAILASIGMVVSNSTDYFWASLIFALLFGFVPVITIWGANRILRNPGYAWIGGGLVVIPGIYAIFVALPESFTPYLLAGGLWFAIVFLADWNWLGGTMSVQRWLIAGMLSGFLHLNRADGLIWIAGTVGLICWRGWKDATEKKVSRIASGILFALVGYSLVMSPWYLRNLDQFGALFPPGGIRTIWLVDYNQTFAYPALELGTSQWLASGWDQILGVRVDALIQNLQNLLVAQGSVVLLPLIGLGLWKDRKTRAVQFGVLLWVGTLIVMTILFPFAGSRGGYLHSGSALQVFFWMMAVSGLEQVCLWGKRARNWRFSSAMPVFGIILIVINTAIAGWFFTSRVIGPDIESPIWNRSTETYKEIKRVLVENGVHQDDLGMVNNPPGFFVGSGMSSIVIPGGDLDSVLEAAHRYGASYLLLEENQTNLEWLYLNPKDQPGLKYVTTADKIQIFRIPGND